MCSVSAVRGSFSRAESQTPHTLSHGTQQKTLSNTTCELKAVVRLGWMSLDSLLTINHTQQQNISRQIREKGDRRGESRQLSLVISFGTRNSFSRWKVFLSLSSPFFLRTNLSFNINRKDHVDRGRGPDGAAARSLHGYRDIRPYYPCLHYSTSYLLWCHEEESLGFLQRLVCVQTHSWRLLDGNGSLMTIDRQFFCVPLTFTHRSFFRSLFLLTR